MEMNIMKSLGYIGKVKSKTQWPPGDLAILLVESLNQKYSWHAVAWIKGELLDPNKGIKGRKAYTKEMLLSPITRKKYLSRISDYYKQPY